MCVGIFFKHNHWFILMGPNTGPGHTSVLVYTEAQIAHTIEAIQKIRNEGLKYVEIRQDVQDRYNEGIQKRMKHMVWGGCKSWYLNAKHFLSSYEIYSKASTTVNMVLIIIISHY
mgnify:CR=1 FL=1